jgi:redox-sensitive bicupin YhaK (pirin superfamily)
MTDRDITRVARAQPTSDGAGVRLNRALGTAAVPIVDPFLMLDEIRSDDAADYIAGFPDHPHRGFETVTYMLAGSMEHKDSVGNTGHLAAGSVQWMTAGRGIIHSETPKQDNGLLWGFQLWVNLPRAQKMVPPRYQDIPPSAVPEVAVGAATVRVLAGEVNGVRGPVEGIATAPLMLDVKLPPASRDADAAGAPARVKLPVAAGHNGFVYVFEGEIRVGATTIPRGHLGVLGPGDALDVAATANGGRFLLLAGKPLGEPVARYGPFVMSTEQEIRQAILDYQAGRLDRP